MAVVLSVSQPATITNNLVNLFTVRFHVHLHGHHIKGQLGCDTIMLQSIIKEFFLGSPAGLPLDKT